MTTGHVNQIRFGFDEHSGRLDVDASSFIDSELTRYWHDELNLFYRMRTVDYARPPESAFTHLRFDEGSSVLLYRRTEPGDAARNQSHALIGCDLDLDELALPLTTWQGWRERWYTGRRLTAQPLESFGVRGEDLDEPSRREDLEASGLLAALLRSPETKFSVHGMRDEHVVPSLWAARRVMTAIADAMSWGRDWTFSTYETSDASRHRLPALLFLPEGSAGAADSGRVRIRHGRLPDEYGMLADNLLSLYRNRSLGEFSREVRSTTYGAQDIHGRIERLLNKWGYTSTSGSFGWSGDETVVAPVVVTREVVPVEQPAERDALVEAVIGLTRQVEHLALTIDQTSHQTSQQRPSPLLSPSAPSYVEPVQFQQPQQPEAQPRPPSQESRSSKAFWTRLASQWGVPADLLIGGLVAVVLVIFVVWVIVWIR